MTNRAEPAVPERNETTGAVVAWAPWPVAKWVVFDCRGHLCGYRREIEAARAFAATLPGEPWTPPAPSPIHRSPRAMPLPAPAYVPPGQQPDEAGWPAKRPAVVHSAAFEATTGRRQRR